MTIIVDKNVAMPMRDGIQLRADIYRPADDVRHPVLLQRTPYNKELWLITAMTLDPVRAAAAGFVVIIQDVRSRWTSEGDVFFPYRNEENDSADSIAWAAEQDFCDGNVGCYGLSYMGGTTWLGAVSGHDALKAISPTTAPNDLWRNHFWRGGALHIGTLASWALRTIGLGALFRSGKPLPELGARLVELVDALDDFGAMISHRPLDKLPPGHPEDARFVPFFYELIKHVESDAWTDGILLHSRHDKVKVPALILAGWHDLLLGSDLENFAGMRQNAATAEARQHTRIIIGPWSHGMFLNWVGQVDFGFRSSGLFLDLKEDLTSLQLRWFNRWLRSEPNGIEQEAPVRLFVQGINRWRDEREWPLQRTRFVPWYLGRGGIIAESMPAMEESPDSYVYDPEDPCPTCGGNLLMPPQYTPGPVDQAPILRRRDVLVFTSAPLPEDMEVTGPVKCELYASTSAPDTDWVVKLCELRPDGTTYNVCDGVLRVSHQMRSENAVYAPGVVVCWHIDLWATAMVFKAGHRLRVTVTSSDFPRYDRNPNTGESGVSAASSVPALQRIYHDQQHPSHLLLPIIPG